MEGLGGDGTADGDGLELGYWKWKLGAVLLERIVKVGTSGFEKGLVKLEAGLGLFVNDDDDESYMCVSGLESML